MEEHGEHRRVVRLALLLALLWPGLARAEQCRIALALGLDVSSSVDGGEYLLQTRGLAAALAAPEVREAFLAVPGEVVALSIYEWSGRRQQITRLDWTVIRSAADLDAIAAQLLSARRGFEQYPTALGHAIIYGAAALAHAPPCAELKLDISGDGTNNDGIPPNLAVPDAPIVINGLTVGGEGDMLARYYQSYVIRGPGAFVEVAAKYDDFEAAMRRKLERELRPAAVSLLRAAPAPRL